MLSACGIQKKGLDPQKLAFLLVVSYPIGERNLHPLQELETSEHHYSRDTNFLKADTYCREIFSTR